MKKLLVAPDIYQLTFDRTGQEPENLVSDEPHTLPAAHERLIVPIYGAFFDDSVVITDVATGNPLTSGQFMCTELIKSATQGLGKPVSRFIHVTDASVSANVLVTYQALGGNRAFDRRKLAVKAAALLAERKTVDWADVQDKPLQYAPTHHLHDAQDLYGLEYINNELDRITDAILVDKRPLHMALKALAMKDAKAADQRYAVLFAQQFKAKINALEVAAGKAPGASHVTGAGTLLLHYCDGTTLMGTYYDGNVNTYNQVIAYNSPTCGAVITPPVPPMIKLTATRGFIWPDVQPRTVDAYGSQLPIPNVDALKVPVGSGVSARAVFTDLKPHTTYTANFASNVQGYAEYTPNGSMSFTSDSYGSGTVDYTWPNGLTALNTYAALQDNRLIVALGPVDSYAPFTAAGGISNAVSVYTQGVINTPPVVIDPKTTYTHPTVASPQIRVLTQQQAINAGSTISLDPEAHYLLMKAPGSGEVPCISYTAPISGRYCFITCVLVYGSDANPMSAQAYKVGLLTTATLHNTPLYAAPYFEWVDMQAGDRYEVQLQPQDNAGGVAAQAMLSLKIVAPDNRAVNAAEDFVTYNGDQRAPWLYFYRGSVSPAGSYIPEGAMVLS